ncbi:Triosephosphate isomerase [Sulfurovum sp. enrichment culture clone C5]|uniref:Triosephosphate isomerase n=1 Tax=Sulfurovum sp. enrichment culture clone C5 TaxID=497650 RepID=A0A0S4XPR5_9BACT|nr:Triosephosphate isomerase [Sulfurovum sp. enrichment culture clone C5]
MIFAANFKTNHTRASTKEYLLALESLAQKSSDEFYIFPPISALCSSASKITIGSQNAYPVNNGAFTGEIGLEQLEEFGIKTILIGHSERRVLLGESQEFIAKKFEFFKNNDFKIIYCIGEPLEVRKEGELKVIEFLAEQFNAIDINYENLIIAYEPIWAIGTGVSATNDQIALTHKAIKKICNKPLLYGGSVNSSNIKNVLATQNVDGVLVGSASLDVQNFFNLSK